MSRLSFHILVCRGPECAGKGDADAVYGRLCALVAERALDQQVLLGRKNCFGRCSRGPNVYVRAVRPHARCSALYNRVSVADAGAIVDQHVLGGRVLERLIEPPVPAAPASLEDRDDPRLARAVLAPGAGTRSEPPENG